jgi:hypothetical protein
MSSAENAIVAHHRILPASHHQVNSWASLAIYAVSQRSINSGHQTEPSYPFLVTLLATSWEQPSQRDVFMSS